MEDTKHNYEDNNQPNRLTTTTTETTKRLTTISKRFKTTETTTKYKETRNYKDTDRNYKEAENNYKLQTDVTQLQAQKHPESLHRVAQGHRKSRASTLQDHEVIYQRAASCNHDNSKCLITEVSNCRLKNRES